ncbi:glycoside hydrolase family 5 protein [Bacteroides sp. UBA939]|uniref:glycoside hydrolase family 5 protein n=1 Tax=Bacteroides sp. UBA939 TaxID=1946092 RepID=UPI0039C8641A
MKSNWKRWLVACLLIFVAVCSANSQKKEKVEQTAAAEQNMRLSVDGTYLVNAKGEKVVLKGVSYGWHNFWPRFYNASSASYLVNTWGAEVVRASMGIELKGGYLDAPQKGIDCVQAVTDAAIEEGIYAIIDWHSHGIRTEEAKEFFRKMATRYKGVPNVIYEIFNEPVEDSWELVKAYSEEVIRVIRSIEPDAVILVGCPHWDQDIHLAADNPITGYNNIMYTLHFYANTHTQWLRDRADYALGKGLPIFVSECAAMEASGDGAINKEEWNKWLDWMQQHSISWVAWSVSDKNETCSMLLPSASSEGNWKDEDLKEWGRMVRDELKKAK